MTSLHGEADRLTNTTKQEPQNTGGRYSNRYACYMRRIVCSMLLMFTVYILNGIVIIRAFSMIITIINNLAIVLIVLSLFFIILDGGFPDVVHLCTFTPSYRVGSTTNQYSFHDCFEYLPAGANVIERLRACVSKIPSHKRDRPQVSMSTWQFFW